MFSRKNVHILVCETSYIFLDNFYEVSNFLSQIKIETYFESFTVVNYQIFISIKILDTLMYKIPNLVIKKGILI